MTEAIRDGNHVTVALGVSSGDSTVTLPLTVDSATGRLLVNSASGSGDVVGPASSTDNAVVRFSGTTGKLVQDSAVTIADTTGVIAGTEGITISGTTSGTTSVVATAIAGTTTLTLPAATDTLVGRDTTDTLTNKTIDGDDNTIQDIDATTSIKPGNAGEQLTTNEAETALEYSLASKYVLGRKGSPGTINAGEPVYISGWNPGQSVIEVELADATQASTMPAVGLAFEEITQAANGRIIISGNTVGIVDTSSWTEGDAVFVSTTAGVLTNVKPAGGIELVQKIGTVGFSNVANGQLTVVGAGRTNDTPNKIEPRGDTATGDNAAVGYTATEGLILAGQGSTNDVTIKNDADENVLSILTGTKNIDLIASSNLQVAGTPILSDSAGTMTLSNIDALDATTETTIETAIDTLSNLTTVGALDSGSITSNFGAIDNGASNITTTGDISGGTVNATGDTSAGDNAAIGYTSTEGLILTGQGSTNDVTVKNDADATVFRIPTGTTNIHVGVDGTATDIILSEKSSLQLDPAGGADGDYSGITVTGTGGATIAFGDTVYLAVADSRWELTDASAVATAGTPLVGIAVTSSTDGNPITVLLQGIIRADAKFPTFTVGAQVFLSETAGLLTNTAPTTADAVVKACGFALTANEVYWNPDSSHITVTG